MNVRATISFVLLCSLYSVNSSGQFIIQGNVYNSNKIELQQVSVVLKDSITAKTIDFTYTNKNGSYKLNVVNPGAFYLEFRQLGYGTKAINLDLKTEQRTKYIDIILEEKPINLDEVIIQAERPISIRNDTVNYKTKYFINGTEQTVEDLLRVMPGLQIDSKGTIKVGNQEIEKIMVDGDDLFDKGYKILSKNMPAYAIEEVELLKNYSNNGLLKGVEESNKIALNLKLDKNSKHIWFGNINSGLSYINFYEIKGNLMNFGKKNKYYFLTNFNNVGYDATGDIQDLIHPFRLDEPSSIGDNEKVETLLNLSPPDLNFKESRVNFNKAKLASFNAIFNPSERLKLKTLAFFNGDITSFFKNNTDVVNVNSSSFTNTEKYELYNKKIIAFGKMEMVYTISKTKVFETSTKLNNGCFTDNSDLVFNNISTKESLQHQNTLFDQKICYTTKISDKKVFLLTGRFINEKAPQNYHINQFFYQELFPEVENADNIEQDSRSQMLFFGINAHLFKKKENGDLLELQLGHEFRKDKINSEFSILNDQTVVEQPLGYQNQTNYQVNDLYFKYKYRLVISDFGIMGNLNFHQLFNRLENDGVYKEQNHFFVNPCISIDWKINDKNKIISTYSYNTINSKIIDTYNDYVLTSYRSFSKGTGALNQLGGLNMIFNYQFGNWSDRFFSSTFFLYNKNLDFFSTNTIINQNFTQTKKILIKDREFLSINSKLDYFIKIISSNIKLELGYTAGQFKNIVNNSSLREVRSICFIYGLELRSGFKGIFNYHVGTSWTTSEVRTTIGRSFTDNMSFFDLFFEFNDKFDVQLQSERYYFGKIQDDNDYYFFDVDARFKVLKGKLTLGLTGKNLFNNQKFKNFSVNDIGTSRTEYSLLPRYVLLKIEYRF
jgi:hypothetical protein